jgi:hypothetical protein
MRGIPEYNYPAFMKAANDLRALGWTVYNPAEMDIEEDHEDYAARTIEEQQLHDTAAAARRFARRDVSVLLDKLAAEKGDAVFVLPGWENSTGANAEVAVARWAMLPVIPVPQDVSEGED